MTNPVTPDANHQDIVNVPLNSCIAKLTWMLTTTGRDWRSGQEFITASHSQAVCDALREALALLQSCRAAANSRSEASNEKG